MLYFSAVSALFPDHFKSKNLLFNVCVLFFSVFRFFDI